MRQIRKGIFETNSSSTHSLTILPYEDWRRWYEGEGYLDDGGNICSQEEAMALVEKDLREWKSIIHGQSLTDYAIQRYPEEDEQAAIERLLAEHYFFTEDTWADDEYLETYSEDYTTKSGDRIIIFGKYGRDG